MKTTRRILAFALALVLTVLSLASCHSRTQRTSFIVPDNFDTEKQFELTFWAKNDSNNVQITIYEKAIADFEKLYPNIKVTLRSYSGYPDIYNDVITNIATNTTPNVCITYPDHIVTYMTGENVVVPLDDLMANEKYGLGGSELKFDSPKQEEIIPEYLNEGKIGEFYYALPYMRSTEACYVNKTYLEKLGFKLPEILTWDFIWEVSEAAIKKGEDGMFAVNGQSVMIPCIYKSTDNMLIQMAKQKNIPYSNDKGEITVFNQQTKDLLKDISSRAGKGLFSTFRISGYPGNYFNKGQCIFAIDSTAGATWMGSDAPILDVPPESVVKFETAVLPVPQYDTAHPVMMSQGPSVCVFNKADPQEVLASWLFAQYLLTNEVQIAYSQTEGYVPVTSKARDSAEYKDYLAREGENNELYYPVKLQATKMLLSNAPNTFVTAVFNGSASLRSAAEQLIEVVSKSGRRHETVDDKTLDKTFKDISSMFHLDSVPGVTIVWDNAK